MKKAAILALVILGLAGAARAQIFEHFNVGMRTNLMAVGPDGAIWFSSAGTGVFGRIDMFGIATAHTTQPYIPLGMTSGPNQSIWFSAEGGGLGYIRQYWPYDHQVLPAGLCGDSEAIAAGSDGNLWVTEPFCYEVDRVSPNGSILNHFAVSAPGRIILAGPDGNLWFSGATFQSNTGILRMTTNGLLSGAFPIPPGYGDVPTAMVFAPDGAIWYTDFYGQNIGRLDTTTGAVQQFNVGHNPTAIAFGPDGALWFGLNDYNSAGIGRLDPVTGAFRLVALNEFVEQIVLGPDNNLWFTTGDQGDIVRILLNEFTSPASATFTVGTWNDFLITVEHPSVAQELTFTGGLPDGVNFIYNGTGSGSASISGVPGPNASGIYPLTIVETTADGTDSQNFTLTVEIPPFPPATEVDDPDPTPDGGAAHVSLSGGGPGCRFNRAAFIPVSGDPRSPQIVPPSGVDFPKALLDFSTTGCDPGTTITITLTYSLPLDPATQYYKYGPQPGLPPDWYVIPSTLLSRRTLSFTITDGGLGDDDLLVNGNIVDAGGPGAPHVSAQADLIVSKSVDDAAPNVGSNVVFTVTASNAGPQGATGVVVTDLLPAGLVFVSASPSQGTYASATGVWSVGSLASSAAATLSIVVTAAQPGSFTNTASKSAEVEHDPNPANDSASVTIQVSGTPPSVTTQPVSQTVCAGQSATFTSAASGNPTPTVQWQASSDGGASFQNVSGATSGSLTISASAADDGKRYRAVFTNSAGSATTNAAVLTVNTAPAVTTQPASQSVAAGQSVTFTAAASGKPAPSVQWQVSSNGGSSFSDIPGATSVSLSFAAMAAQNGYLYRAIFTNACGSATSNAAALTVTTGCTALTIEPASLRPGVAGWPYFQLVRVDGPNQHVEMRLGAGAPSWLSLQEHILFGMPPTPGRFTFTVLAVDAKGCTGSRTYTLEIRCPEMVLEPKNLPDGIVGKRYSHQVEVEGALGPVTFAVTDGALPPGLSLAMPGGGWNHWRGARAILTGVPSQAGQFTFTIAATTPGGCSASRRYTVSIAAAKP